MTGKPRKTMSGANNTISLTDGEWEEIRAWAKVRGKSAAVWFRECALSVDLSSKAPASRPLVLDADRQRAIARAMAKAARSMHCEDDISAGLAEEMLALMAARLRAMAREGRRERAVELLRRVFGDEHAAAIAAAYVPETGEDTAETADKPDMASAGAGSGKPADRQALSQRDLFG